MDKHQLAERYGASEHGAFKVIDTIGVPHPYCIGAWHVEHAADHHSGMLGHDAIECGERQKRPIVCDICKGKLVYSEHKTALLIECRDALKSADGMANPELHAYLLAAKAKCEEDRFVGFAFVKAK